MALLVVGTEKNFAALRPRLFEGRISTKVAGEVAEAIRASNPHADLDKLAPGTVLTIPDVPKVRVRGELSLDETTRSGIDSLVEAGRAALEQLAAAAADRERASAAERKELANALEMKELATAARKEPALRPDVESARAAVEQEEARARERAAALKKAQVDWSAELDELKTLVE
jgi:hypothetical protein